MTTKIMAACVVVNLRRSQSSKWTGLEVEDDIPYDVLRQSRSERQRRYHTVTMGISPLPFAMSSGGSITDIIDNVNENTTTIWVHTGLLSFSHGCWYKKKKYLEKRSHRRFDQKSQCEMYYDLNSLV